MANFYYSEPISFVEAPAGQAGRGIQSITFAYCRTDSDAQPTSGWKSDFPEVDAAKPYLWTQITYNYTTGGSEIAYTVTKNGEDGKPGKDGIQITTIVTEYCRSNDGVTTPALTENWESTMPAFDASKLYLWTKIVYQYSDNTESEPQYMVTKDGVQGVDGKPGKDGTQITSITTTYARSDNSTTTPQDWLDTIPTVDSTKPYLWTRIVYNYNDNTSSEPQYTITKDGEKGEPGGNAAIIVSPTAVYKGLTYDLSTHKVTAQLTYDNSIQTFTDKTFIQAALIYSLTQGVHYFRIDNTHYVFIEFASDESKENVSKIISSQKFYYRVAITNNVDDYPTNWGDWKGALNAGDPILIATTTDEETAASLNTYLYLRYHTSKGDEANYRGQTGISSDDGTTYTANILTQVGSHIAAALASDDLKDFHAANWKELAWHTLVGDTEVENLALSTSIPEDAQTLILALSSYAAEYNGLQFTGYYEGKPVCYYTLPFSLDKDLLELGNIDENGDVVIADNKVAADSIAANAITAEKIEAYAINASKIKAGAITSDKISTDGLQSKETVKFKEDSKYTETGSAITFGYQEGMPAGIYFKNFYIDQEGNAGFKGSITATEGATFAGWKINSTSIQDSSNTMGLYNGKKRIAESLVTAGGTSPYRFFSGGIIGNENETAVLPAPVFAVLADGSLYSSQAKMDGLDITGGQVSGILRIGGDSTGIVADGTNGVISSPNYSDNLGWHIDKEGNASFNNLAARGKLSSVVFEQNKVSAVGGSLYISPTVYFTERSISVAGFDDAEATNIKITFNQGANDFTKFNINSPVLLNFITNNGQEYNNIKGAIASLDKEATAESQKTITITIAKTAVKISTFESIEPGCMMASTGTESQSTYILLSATGPYIELNTAQLNQTMTMPCVRLGSLEDIRDNDFGKLDGFGLYSTNAYLRGQVILPNAGITNQTEIKVNDNAVRFWAGKNGDNIGDSNFVVTQDGSLYANKGIFKGIIEATDGTFSGTLKAAGIVIDKRDTPETTQKENEFFVAYTSTPTTVDDYVLRINNKGLSIWEGGLAAYSDYLNGWANNASQRDGASSIAPYGNKENDESAMYPYLSLVDSATPHLTTKGLHIFDVSPSLVGKSARLNADKLVFARAITVSSTSTYSDAETVAYQQQEVASISVSAADNSGELQLNNNNAIQINAAALKFGDDMKISVIENVGLNFIV